MRLVDGQSSTSTTGIANNSQKHSEYLDFTMTSAIFTDSMEEICIGPKRKCAPLGIVDGLWDFDVKQVKVHRTKKEQRTMTKTFFCTYAMAQNVNHSVVPRASDQVKSLRRQRAHKSEEPKKLKGDQYQQ